MDCRSAAAQRTLSPELPATACSVLPRRRRNGPACHLDLAVCVDGSDRLGLDLNPIRGVVGVIALPDNNSLSSNHENRGHSSAVSIPPRPRGCATGSANAKPVRREAD